MSSIVNDVNGVKSTFSSWDSCMSKAYCKWPAIIGIVIGSLIALSILWCIFSCLCCGVTLCNACVKCITCGGCCGACGRGGGGGGGGRSRHKDDYQPMPATPQPYQGYQSQPAPMMYNQNGPQFATFDAPSNRGNSRLNGDALPPMPSWDNARTRQVEDTDPHPTARPDDLEMGSLRPQQQQARGGYNSVPHEPLSPAAHDFENPHDSGLGAQRLSQPPGGYSDHASDDRAFSPAPTYATHDPQADRFAPGMAAPMPGQYNQQRTMSPQDQSPYGPRRAMSPPQNQYHQRTMSPSNAYQQRTMSPPQPTPMPAPQRQNSAPYPADSPSDNTSYEPPRQQSNFIDYQHRSMSPPQQRAFSPYQPFGSPPPQNNGNGARPPSLLQVGRKAVPGSAREI